MDEVVVGFSPSLSVSHSISLLLLLPLFIEPDSPTYAQAQRESPTPRH